MKKTLAVILVIALVLLGSAFALDGIARKNAQQEHVWLMETLLPGGKDFVRVTDIGDDNIIRSVHKASEGFVIETVTYGYADEITVLVGLDNKGVVTGLVTLDAHETYGLGSGILTDHGFLSQFLDETGTFTLGAGDSSADWSSSATSETASVGEEIYIDGISGATVSSKAVARCVNAAIAYVTGADIDSSATSWGE